MPAAKPFKLAIHIFRRDLRLSDNSALLGALEQAEQVLPVFIFDPRQLKEHDYRSLRALDFMLLSLEQLDRDLAAQGARLGCLVGEPKSELDRLLLELKPEALFFNADYSRFSRKRDAELAQVCRSHGVRLQIVPDALLTVPGKLLKADGSPYTVFTPFYKRALLEKIPAPRPLAGAAFLQSQATLSLNQVKERLDLAWPKASSESAGRVAALRILSGIKSFSDYAIKRDIPALDGTTQLAVHNKFGTVSVREVYSACSAAFGPQNPLARQLFWRDFFSHIAWHFPKVFGSAFHSELDTLPWENSEQCFKAWSEGLTGFPLIDAGQRQLNSTGFMHNRARMVSASFLVKDLLVDWRWGERYFAQQLLDYDPAVNNGNWQWAASTGCDAQPYFRVFNPWLQQKKFDPECAYIKRWLPELRELPARELHNWPVASKTHSGLYPRPIVDHDQQRARLLRIFEEAK